MTMRMLIDARHREETRVAVVKGNRIEEFDFESEERKQLKGNIYLAKVTRVEPSLQAAFVDYGGNRHGFLAFSEIHPDYYQIPKEDREALLREEAEHAAQEEAYHAEQDDEGDDGEGEDEPADAGAPQDLHADDEAEGEGDAPPPPRAQSAGGNDENTVEALRTRRMNLRRRYKIQDVIRRRQVLLVQVVKEERGNKGAALTTYLSLAGRYCVLMPNTSHGGGISRKISNAADRKRLKSIMAELDLPRTMGCIVRTAGLQRTKAEIKRDFDYLARVWDEVRETTLGSAAPALIYGDSDLIKRAIRDIYNKDIDEVIVEGEEGFRQARSFMKMLMPTHAKKVVPYADAVPLYQRFGVEDQLGAMYQPLVQLKSGGYLVINPTEALVSIDINSGRSTREHNIEQTALNTNLEASHEIARQLRLRDMAGLVVIDFIDMESNSNNRKVEKAMKEALKNDRARIQVGRISSFGLFEMSRQRLRTGVLEASTRTCPHCEGTGLVRTASSAGLSALRMLEDEAARGRGSRLCLRTSQEAAFYVLNRKRLEISEIEERYGVLIEVLPDGSFEGARMAVESAGPPPAYAPRLPAPIAIPLDEDDDLPEIEEDEELETAEEGDAGERGEERGARDDRDESGRRRRRRRRRGGRREEGDEAPSAEGGEDEAAERAEGEEGAEPAEREDSAEAVDAPGEEGGARRRRSRRGRRGGRRDEQIVTAEAPAGEVLSVAANELALGTAPEAPSDDEDPPIAEPQPLEAMIPEATGAPEAPAPKARRRPRARPVEADTGIAAADAPDAPADEPAAKPRRGRRKAVGEEAVAPSAEAVAETGDAPAGPRRGRRRTAAVATTEAAAAPIADDVAALERSTTAPLVAPPAKDAAAADGVAADTRPDTAPTAGPATGDADEVSRPETAAALSPEAPNADAPSTEDEEPGSPRRGWWQRTFGN